MNRIYIKPSGKFAEIDCRLPKALVKILDRELRWTSVEDIGNPLRFYNKEDNLLYAGCVYRAKKIIEDYYAEKNKFVKVIIKWPKDDSKEFDLIFSTSHLKGKSNPKRVGLQKDLVKSVIKARHGIGQAVPGFGKTVCMADIISRIGRQAVVVVGAKEPRDQAVLEIGGALNTKVNVVGTGRNAKFDNINVLTIQTWNALRKSGHPVLKQIRRSKVVIIDECHNAAANTYLEFLDDLKAPDYVIGLSATPYRHDDKESILYARIGDIAFECPYDVAVDAEILVPMYLFTEGVPERDYGYAEDKDQPFHVKRRRYQKVVREYVYENETRNEMLLSFCRYAWKEAGATSAIICDSIPHMEILCGMDRDLVMVHGHTKPNERKEIWEAFRNHEIMRVCSTLLDEATNIPSLGAVAVAAPGKSKVTLVQRQRQLRWFEGTTVRGDYKKEFGMLYWPMDNVDYLKSHSRANVANLRKEFIKKHSACREYNLGRYGG